MNTINLGSLKQGPHATLIDDMASKCAADQEIQAIWVGGSLASGTGDAFSDIDFRIAVAPGQLERWQSPNWDQYLPISPAGGSLMQFGEQALLHHLVLRDGTILDFYVQDTQRQNFEPQIVILMCRDAMFQAQLEGFSRAAAPLVHPIDGDVVRQFLIDYWITTHKEMKGLARRYDLSPFVGLYWEQLSLLRAWHMQLVGKDIKGRATLHMLGKLHAGLEEKLSPQQRAILGRPSQTPEETAIAVEGIRAEMAQVGRWLADRHSFSYPQDIEAVVQQAWTANRASIIERANFK